MRPATGTGRSRAGLVLSLVAAMTTLAAGCGRRPPAPRARRLAARGRWAAAEAAALRAVETEPESAEFHLLLGRIQKARSSYPEAIESFESARRIDVSLPAAPYNLGVIHEEIGELERSADFYREALELNPELAPALFRMAGVMLRRGRLEEAEAAYRRFLNQEPDHPEARNNLGVVYFRRGDAAAARAEFVRALEADPGSPRVLFNLGLLSLAAGDEAEAREIFERLRALRPGSASAIEAEALLERLSPAPPEEGESGRGGESIRRGAELEREGRLEEAAEAYRAALIPGEDFRAHYHLGRLYERKGEGVKAVDHYEKFLSLHRDLSSETSSEVLGRLGELRARLGPSLLVRGDLPPTPPPTPPPPPGAADYHRRGRRAAEREEWQTAADEYQAALAADPGHAPSWLGLGEALRRAGDYSGARSALEKARDLDPLLPAERELAGLFLDTASALASEGKHREAIEYFRLARRAGLEDRADEGIWKALRDIAAERIAAGDHAGAASRLEESLAIRNSHAPTRLELGDLYARRLNRPDQARGHYREYLRLAPRGAEAGRVREYLTPPSTPPPPPPAPPPPTPAVGAEVYYNRAVEAQRRGRVSEAERDYLRAIEARDDFYRAHFNLGTLYRDTDRLEPARRAFQRALEIEPNFSPAHLALFNLHRGRLPDPSAARRHARRFVELEPGSEPARILREWLGE